MSAGVAQAVACSTGCPAPAAYSSRSSSWLRVQSRRTSWCQSRRAYPSIRAVSAPEECNQEDCAPEKEVGKISMDWVAEEKTKVSGTFPPMAKGKWTGYVEKDTAGQTNIYAVEPTVYVAESAISSGTAGVSSDGTENTLAVSVGFGLILIAGAAVVLLRVGNSSSVESPETAYAGPSLSFYVQKFQPPAVVEAASPVAPDLTTPVDTALTSPEPEPPIEAKASLAVAAAPGSDGAVQAVEGTISELYLSQKS